MGGVAVRAVGGRRAEYRPLATPLAASSDPCAVAEGFLRLHPFGTIYLADLDAIMEQGGDDRALSRLSAAFPSVTFWIDRGGLAPPAAANFTRVIGSESLSPTCAGARSLERAQRDPLARLRRRGLPRPAGT